MSCLTLFFFLYCFFFFFSSRRRHTRLQGDWSSDVCSSDLQKVIFSTICVRVQTQVPETLQWTYATYSKVQTSYLYHFTQDCIFRVHVCALLDRKSTRLNSSHLVISYAVFCLKKKKNHVNSYRIGRRELQRVVNPHLELVNIRRRN